MIFRTRTIFATMLCLLAGLAFATRARAADDPGVAEVRASADQMVKAFNAGKADDMAALFALQGEMIDEDGDLLQGRKEIAEIFTKYFQKFPGAKLTLKVESARTVGPNMAIEEGTRYITAPGNGTVAKAQLRYIAVSTKTDGKWQIASLRESADDPAPSPHERLEDLAWLAGDWVNEGSNMVVKIKYRWSDDGNYLLGDYQVTKKDKATQQSTQRIGWDPQANKIRSWLFDADGGFTEAVWTMVDDDWVVKSSSVNPDGQAASVTISVETKDKDHFVMRGTDRIVGDSKEPDFEITITRAPPAAKK